MSQSFCGMGVKSISYLFVNKIISCGKTNSKLKQKEHIFEIKLKKTFNFVRHVLENYDLRDI